MDSFGSIKSGRGSQQFSCGTAQLSYDSRLWGFVCGRQKEFRIFDPVRACLRKRRALRAFIFDVDSWNVRRIGRWEHVWNLYGKLCYF